MDPCKRCWGVGSVIKIVQVPKRDLTELPKGE